MANGPNKPVTNVVTRTYKDGSIIYFEGDRSDYVYILKSGRVILSFIKIETGEEMKEMIKVGEFFGVKSTIGKYPREETAQTIGDVSVLAVSRADFEKMILKNVALVTKMLRVFSNQLRRITKAQREILGETDTINPAVELFKIGEYYYKSGNSQAALYVYKRYLEHYPGTKFSEKAMQRIRSIETGDMDDDIDTPVESAPEPASSGDDDFGFDDFSIDDNEGGSDTGGGDDFSMDEDSSGGGSSNDSGGMDDFFLDDDQSLDDFSFDDDDMGGGSKQDKQQDITEIFYEAVSLFSQENYSEALGLYKNILGIKSLKNDSERKIFEKTHFEIGRCYLKLGKPADAITSLSGMIKKFPRTDLEKNALYHIGLAYEIGKKVDKAIVYYKKVASMDPKDSINKLAMKKLSSLK